MQTFLPYPDFVETARCLDDQRLGKQRVECLQILKTIINGEGSWFNHPAVQMWIPYRFALYYYGNMCCKEWRDRGYGDTCGQKMFDLLVKSGNAKGPFVMPPWIGEPKFHDSHKSNLLQKDYDFYKQYAWDVPIDLTYYWPEN